jgi:uncharacterized membrane protein
VIASGLLCGALALVVVFTTRGAFFSPLALVVVAAIGLVAVLLQLRLYNRKEADKQTIVHPPFWLNLVGILLALGALLADRLRLEPLVTQALALGAVGSFAISGAVILHAFRKSRVSPKQGS